MATETVERRQLRFAGFDVREQTVSFAGKAEIDADTLAQLKLGRSFSLTVSGVVKADGHQHKEDADSGEEYAARVLTLKVERVD